MTRILLDQGLPRSTANLLRDEGWDVQHTGDIGLGQSTDRQILEYARREEHVVITLDSDFHAMLAVSNASSPSVIRIRMEGIKGPDLAALIKRIWPTIESQVTKGAMVTVTESGFRIRNIPLFSP